MHGELLKKSMVDKLSDYFHKHPYVLLRMHEKFMEFPKPTDIFANGELSACAIAMALVYIDKKEIKNFDKIVIPTRDSVDLIGTVEVSHEPSRKYVFDETTNRPLSYAEVMTTVTYQVRLSTIIENQSLACLTFCQTITTEHIASYEHKTNRKLEDLGYVNMDMNFSEVIVPSEFINDLSETLFED